MDVGTLTDNGVAAISVSLCGARIADYSPEETQGLHGVGIEDCHTIVIGRTFVYHQTIRAALLAVTI